MKSFCSKINLPIIQYTEKRRNAYYQKYANVEPLSKYRNTRAANALTQPAACVIQRFIQRLICKYTLYIASMLFYQFFLACKLRQFSEMQRLSIAYTNLIFGRLIQMLAFAKQMLTFESSNFLLLYRECSCSTKVPVNAVS